MVICGLLDCNFSAFLVLPFHFIVFQLNQTLTQSGSIVVKISNMYHFRIHSISIHCICIIKTDVLLNYYQRTIILFFSCSDGGFCSLNCKLYLKTIAVMCFFAVSDVFCFLFFFCMNKYLSIFLTKDLTSCFSPHLVWMVIFLKIIFFWIRKYYADLIIQYHAYTTK